MINIETHLTPEQFEESLKWVKARGFMNGKQCENILENGGARTVAEANKPATHGRWTLSTKI
jgi:hypothetical protein